MRRIRPRPSSRLERQEAPDLPDALDGDVETDEVPLAEQPTAEVERPPPVPEDPQGPVWLAAGIALVVIGVVAGLVAVAQ
ncbi:MAG: hypothetical protein R3F59_37720 [Myxococcota bacterium]